MPACPHHPSRRASTPRLHPDDVAFLPDDGRGEQTTRPPHAEQGVMKSQRHVTTRGGITSADVHVLLLLAVSRALPARRGCGPVSKGMAWELGGLPQQDRTPGRACEVGNHNITQRNVLEAMSQVTL